MNGLGSQHGTTTLEPTGALNGKPVVSSVRLHRGSNSWNAPPAGANVQRTCSRKNKYVEKTKGTAAGAVTSPGDGRGGHLAARARSCDHLPRACKLWIWLWCIFDRLMDTVIGLDCRFLHKGGHRDRVLGRGLSGRRGKGGARFVHGRSHMTIDPRIHTMP